MQEAIQGLQRKLMSLKLQIVLIAVSCIWVAAGCRSYYRDGELRVYKGLRMFPTELSFPSPSNGVIRVAVQPSPTEVALVWHSFEVVDGAMTIYGRNGTFRIEQGNAFTVDIEDFGCFTGKLNKASARFHLDVRNEDDDTQKFRFSASGNWSWQDNYPVPNEDSAKKGKYWDRANPHLHSVASNGWRHIKIPYSVSTNFQGNMGRLTLESNAYYY